MKIKSIAASGVALALLAAPVAAFAAQAAPAKHEKAMTKKHAAKPAAEADAAKKPATGN